MKQPYVSTLIEQNFTSGEKARARENIDAISSADLAEYATHDWVEGKGYLTSADIPSPIPEASANQFLASDQLGNMEWKSLKLVDDRVQAGSYINLERQEYADHVETTINCTGLQPSGDYVETSDIAGMATQTWVNEHTSAFVTQEDIDRSTSGKMDATEASAFYPRYSNPEGYLTSVPSTYATKQYVSSVAQGITDWASGEFYPLSNPSGYITSADVPQTSGMATKEWTYENFYSASNPSGFVTSAAIPKLWDGDKYVNNYWLQFVAGKGLSNFSDVYDDGSGTVEVVMNYEIYPRPEAADSGKVYSVNSSGGTEWRNIPSTTVEARALKVSDAGRVNVIYPQSPECIELHVITPKSYDGAETYSARINDEYTYAINSGCWYDFCKTQSDQGTDYWYFKSSGTIL